jgi:GTPase SAR1 family protein
LQDPPKFIQIWIFGLKIYHLATLILSESKQLWDIAGQERFGNMTRVYYKEAVGAFVVFDVTRTDTFAAVEKWKNDLDTKVLLPDGRPIPCILVGLKKKLGQCLYFCFSTQTIHI